MPRESLSGHQREHLATATTDIALLYVLSMILANIIIKQIADAADAGMQKEQAGFRKERGCTDQSFTLCNIIEQCTEWQLSLIHI